MSRSIACIDYRNGKVFIAKRQMKGDMGGRWEFPGGKIEKNEDFEAAIKREMMEEFGVEVTVGQHITSTTFYHKEKECFLDAFEVHFAHDGIQNPFVLTEHTEYRWENIENPFKGGVKDTAYRLEQSYIPQSGKIVCRD